MYIYIYICIVSPHQWLQFIMQNKLVSKSSIRDEDPQAELLKYAEQSDANPVYLCKSINTQLHQCSH